MSSLRDRQQVPNIKKELIVVLVVSLSLSFQEQCKSLLEFISHQINNQHSELAGHHLLSILKMAETQVVMPEVSAGGRRVAGGDFLVILLNLLVVSLCLLRNEERIGT